MASVTGWSGEGFCKTMTNGNVNMRQAEAIQTMKLKLTVLVLLAATLAGAQTNNLTALLQQGLFEEQANRNLDAAIADYQSLARQFDKDRQLAATAVFRLGECYRMQGKTNEAALEYKRIVNEFSDQTPLVTLSRQNLAGIGAVSQTSISTSTSTSAALDNWPSQYTLLQSQYALLKAQLEQARHETNNEIVAELFNDNKELAEGLRLALSMDTPLQSMLQEAKTSGNPELVKDRERILKEHEQAVEKARQQILDFQEIRVKSLQSAIEGGWAVESRQISSTNAATHPADVEAQEIARIQQMIQNSPDLINSASDGSTPLVKAAYNGWLKVAAYLLDHGADVNVPCAQLPGLADSPNRMGPITPLIAAVTIGNKAMTEYLISRGADINFTGRLRDTPLHVAAQKGFQAVMDALLFHHANVNAPNISGATPLFSAVSGGRLSIVKALLAAGADVNLCTAQSNSVLNYAIGTAPEMMQTLLAAGANPNTVDVSGRTPLSYAVERESSQSNRQFGSGRVGRSTMPSGGGGRGGFGGGLGAMPLNRPAETDSPEIVKLLLTAKADPNGGKIDAPLLCAVFSGNTETAELLLAAGANPNEACEADFGQRQAVSTDLQNHENHLTPLWLATFLNEPSIVQLLLKYKADPDDSQTDGRALIFNVLDKPDVLNALLDASAKVDAIGFSPNAKVGNDEFRWTPLGMAAFMNSGVAVESLLKHAANPNFRDPVGHYTPLHWAADRVADRQVFELLLAYKADRNVRDINGQTPLDILKEKAKPDNLTTDSAGKAKAEELADMLRKHGALDVLPDWDRITVSRPSANFSGVVFGKGTNDYNRFTLLEVLAVHYGLVSANPRPRPPEQMLDPMSVILDGSLQFPNLENVTIRRPSSTDGKWREIKADVSAILKSGDCSQDVWLEWGDQVELQETDHPISSKWPGFPNDDRAALRNCLKRRVLLTVKGETTNIVLEAYARGPTLILGAYGKIAATLPQFSLAPVLDNSGMVRASSDLSRVKVTRQNDPGDGKMHQWVLDCSDPNNSPALWLRDGDVIEVPEKP